MDNSGSQYSGHWAPSSSWTRRDVIETAVAFAIIAIVVGFGFVTL